MLYEVITLMDEGLSHEVEIDGVEFDAVKARDINGMGELRDALENLAEDVARKLCSVLEPQPWRRITSYNVCYTKLLRFS